MRSPILRALIQGRSSIVSVIVYAIGGESPAGEGKERERGGGVRGDGKEEWKELLMDCTYSILQQPLDKRVTHRINGARTGKIES